MLYFKHMSGSVPHFPKWGSTGPFGSAQFMWLQDMLRGPLRVIKFDIELVVMYFFENLFLLFLILKCIERYLGFPLIVVYAYNML